MFSFCHHMIFLLFLEKLGTLGLGRSSRISTFTAGVQSSWNFTVKWELCGQPLPLISFQTLKSVKFYPVSFLLTFIQDFLKAAKERELEDFKAFYLCLWYLSTSRFQPRPFDLRRSDEGKRQIWNIKFLLLSNLKQAYL